jgi:TPR repeat protein
MSKLLQVLVMLFCAAGIAKDYTPAEIKALLAAAEKGDARAQYEYGLAHYHVAAGGGGYVIQVGLNGGPPNPVEAAKWFLKAAAQGHADACYDAATMYDNGVGLIVSGIEAEKWMKEYAKNKPSEGGRLEYIMASFYAKDRTDLPKDEKTSVAWYRKAAILSSGPGPDDSRWIEASRHALGAYYFDPKSASPKNPAESYAWWSVAAVSGNALAAKNRDQVERHLSPEQVKMGRDLARRIMEEIEASKKSAK